MTTSVSALIFTPTQDPDYYYSGFPCVAATDTNYSFGLNASADNGSKVLRVSHLTVDNTPNDGYVTLGLIFSIVVPPYTRQTIPIPAELSSVQVGVTTGTVILGFTTKDPGLADYSAKVITTAG